MRKKILPALFLVLLLATSFVLFACDKTDNEDDAFQANLQKQQGFDFSLNKDGTYAVKKYYPNYSNTLGVAVIPDSFNGCAVKGIGSSAFSGCSGLTSVEIPDSVTSIGDDAFKYCYKLVEVYNKSSLSITKGREDYGYVGYYAKNIYTPSSGSSKLTTDENGYTIYTDGEDKILMGYTGQETDLTLPADITEIYQYAFYKCDSLTSVVIPDSVTSIGEDAFYDCSKLTSVVIGNNVTSIDKYAFEYCYKLVEVYNKSSLSLTKESNGYGYVGCYAKEIYTTDYTTKLSTDENGYTIYTDGEDKILIGYTGQETELTLPAGITEINQYAFYACGNLTSVVIPDSVTSIDYEAFYKCSGLTSVVIGNGVMSIGTCTFEYCSGLTSVEIPDSVTSIGSSVFKDCSGLTSVTIGNSVTSIGSKAFQYCRGLTSVVIPNGVTSIDKNTFYYCSGLTSIEIPDSVTSIGSSAFRGCSELTSVRIANGVTSIGSYAFAYCSELTSVEILDSVTSIGNYVFSFCSKLTSITVSSENTKYQSSGNCLIETASKTLILGCKSSIIPSDGTVTSIADYAFDGCKGLTSIVIPDSVTSIGSFAFEYCSGLTSIVIPESVTSIGDKAFYVCRGLTSIKIPDSVTSIGSYAFYDCSKLTSVTFENTSGWYVTKDSSATSGTNVTVTDSSINATYLKSTYDSYYWKRK